MNRAWSRPGKVALILAALAALALAGGDAWARGGGSGGGGKSGHSGGKHGGHHSHGSHYSHGSGSVFFYGGYWAAPLYWLGESYPPAEPLHYIERSQEEQFESRWYFCESSSAYFPYVLECAGGWVEVAPFAQP